MDELYIGTAIGLIYLIVEIVINKVNQTDSPTLFKDSMIVSVISILVLYAKNYYFNCISSICRILFSFYF